MQTVIGGIVVVALIYWAQGDGTHIAWIAGLAGLLIGLPLILGVIRQARERASRGTEMDRLRTESLNRNATVRPRMLADLDEWRRRAEVGRQAALLALAGEARDTRRAALERLALRFEDLVKVHDSDPAFLPKVRLYIYELVVAESSDEGWNTRHRYKLWLNREFGGNELLLDVPLEEGREAVWGCLLDNVFRKTGEKNADDVGRVAAELGVVPSSER